MLKTPFLSFGPHHDPLREVVLNAIARVYDSHWYVLGEKVARFEKAYSAFNGVHFCVGVANGLNALVLALRVLGVGSGYEVIVPFNTYIATWLAVTQVGATPVAVEPKRATCNLDPALLQAAITPRAHELLSR